MGPDNGDYGGFAGETERVKMELINKMVGERRVCQRMTEK